MSDPPGWMLVLVMKMARVPRELALYILGFVDYKIPWRMRRLRVDVRNIALGPPYRMAPAFTMRTMCRVRRMIGEVPLCPNESLQDDDFE